MTEEKKDKLLLGSTVPGDSLRQSPVDPSVVWRVEIFQEEDGRFACEFTSADGNVGGMANYSSTPVGALAELCAALIKIDEDDAVDRRDLAETKALLQAQDGEQAPAVEPSEP